MDFNSIDAGVDVCVARDGIIVNIIEHNSDRDKKKKLGHPTFSPAKTTAHTNFYTSYH